MAVLGLDGYWPCQPIDTKNLLCVGPNMCLVAGRVCSGNQASSQDLAWPETTHGQRRHIANLGPDLASVVKAYDQGLAGRVYRVDVHTPIRSARQALVSPTNHMQVGRHRHLSHWDRDPLQ
jgi:hypothetical protein